MYNICKIRHATQQKKNVVCQHISYLLADEDCKIISQAGCRLLHEFTWNCDWIILRNNILPLTFERQMLQLSTA